MKNARLILYISIITVMLMGLFGFLKTKKTDNDNHNEFVSEQHYKANSIKQMQMTPQTMSELRKIGVNNGTELKLEYFFYTSTNEKAQLFSNVLSKLGYSVNYGQSAGDKSLFVINGWTTKMKMEDNAIAEWTKSMCDIGYKYDCDFDGWGTSPNQ